MRLILFILTASTLLVNCGTPKATNTAKGTGTTAKRWNGAGADSNSGSDTVIITGSEYIPVHGKSETGMRPDLEGTWVLGSMTATDLKNPNNIIANKAAEPAGVRVDTVRTRAADGSITTIYMPNKDTTKKITPVQGNNLHEAEKPSLSFFGSNETFSGFTGCNKIAGRFQVTGTNSISFQHSNPSTRMVCIGAYDEAAFLNTLKRVNTFKSANGQLQLMEGTNVLLTFTRR